MGIFKEISWKKNDQYTISPIWVGELANTGWRFGQYRLTIWPILVGDLVNTGWRFGQYQLVISSIPVGQLANTGWRIGQYRLANWPIPVGDFANTGEGTFSKIWAGSRSKSKILKTWRVLELCLDMESSIKKKSIFLFPCPFKHLYKFEGTLTNFVMPWCGRRPGRNDHPPRGRH